jgi:hypothetical protein
MRTQKFLPIAICLFLMTFPTFAGEHITGYCFNDDGDGALVCTSTNFNYDTAFLSMSGNLFSSPGHMKGEIFTDTDKDPTMTLQNSIDNDTGTAWSGFVVNIYMNTSFSLANATVSAPAGWTAAISGPVGPVGQPSFYNSGEYLGTITFSSGDLVAPGANFDFGFTLSFSGSRNYQFTEELIPVAVPEPTALALAGLGGVLLAVWRSRRS